MEKFRSAAAVAAVVKLLLAITDRVTDLTVANTTGCIA